MVLKKAVAYSKPCKTPSGKTTLCLHSKDNKVIEYRACDLQPDGHFKCPTDKKEKKKLAKVLKIEPLNKKLYNK